MGATPPANNVVPFMRDIPEMPKTRVLIVDDSVVMQRLIRAQLVENPNIEVVGAAGDPFEARNAIKALSPDVITLDVEMPGMDGIEFLKRIMKLRPMPVIMVSTLTQRGAATAIEALSLGAIECVGKPVNGGGSGAFHDLAAKVQAAARVPLAVLRREQATPQPIGDFEPNGRIVTIGASTGGVDAIRQVLSAFPVNCPPTLIVQHMPRGFTRSFADRLCNSLAPHVVEAVDGQAIRPGNVYIAPSGASHLEIAGRSSLRCRVAEGQPVSGHRPSADVLFRSAAALGSRAVGAILTGMGRDGADGMQAMRAAGASTIGQDRDTSVVFGMPRAAREAGGVEKVVALQGIANAILAHCNKRGPAG